MLRRCKNFFFQNRSKVTRIHFTTSVAVKRRRDNNSLNNFHDNSLRNAFRNKKTQLDKRKVYKISFRVRFDLVLKTIAPLKMLT